MFIDEVKVTVKAGDGGNGCISFRREKYEPFGGPNGGDGGRGGDIVLVGERNVNDLTAYRFQPIHRAKNGEHGRGSDQNGRGGEDTILKLPLGTLVIDEETGNPVAEILEEGERVVLRKGGNGGWGNARFKSSTNRAPRRANPGAPGEEGIYKMILKVIAEIGLVGFPNAGKSSLTNTITRARPKTAPYPFTTLHPQIGVVEYPEEHDRLFLADIPGLITGASENRGLGHRFLRHIERCQILLLIIDIAGVDQRDPCDDYENLLEELRLYDSELLDKPRLVAANKIDLPEAEENLVRFRKRFSVDLLPISCAEGDGIEALKERLLREVRRMREAPEAPSDE